MILFESLDRIRRDCDFRSLISARVFANLNHLTGLDGIATISLPWDKMILSNLNHLTGLDGIATCSSDRLANAVLI